MASLAPPAGAFARLRAALARRFSLYPEWRTILFRAWSMRLMGLSILFSGIEAGLPHLNGVLPVSAGTFSGLSFLATVLAGLSRLIAQKSLGDEQ